MISVALVDDEPLFTSGLTMVLDAQPDLTVVWRAQSGRDAIERCAATPPDVLLLDIRMPGIDGLDTARRLIGSGATAKIVMLTTFSADEYVLSAIEAGAAGFLLKNTPPDGLVEAIRTVVRGDAILSPEPTRSLFAAYRAHGSAGERRIEATNARALATITEREREVLGLVGRGLTNQEICDLVQLALLALRTGAAPL